MTSMLIDELAAEMYRLDLAADPLYASQIGNSEYIGQLPDLSRDAREHRRHDLVRLQARVEAVTEDGLDTERRITRQVLLRKVSDALLDVDAAAIDYTVGPTTQSGVAANVIIAFAHTPLDSATDAESYLERCAKVPQLLGDAVDRLADGRAVGRTPVARLTNDAIDQLTAYLDSPLAADPLLSAAEPAAGFPVGWHDRLLDVIRDSVRPAMAAYRDRLRAEVLPGARSDDRVGLATLPGGAELYERLAARHTTTDDSVADIHRIGLDVVDELIEEMRERGAALFGTSDFAEIKSRLRTDDELYFSTPDEIVAAAQDALTRAERELPRWLGLLPTVPCVVRPMHSYEVDAGTLGYYEWPTADGSRPGTYWINTSKSHTRPRFESQTLAFHESVPGHHTQLALSWELSELPEFRRQADVTAFIEGWGLYAERLADEMGLYSGDVERLGMVSFDFWRACRLVVDTGMHAMGWSRQRAIDYMREYSALTEQNIVNEVDRYISWPGQALGYMVGRLEMRRLRAEAEKTLGAQFDIRQFHAELLGHGSLPLSVLREHISQWIEHSAVQ